MTSQPQEIFQTVLDFGPLSRIRRNHGLEHATLHLLAEKYPHQSLAGHSDLGGFWILGDVPTEAVSQAVYAALERLRGGEEGLAVHPNCGTNFVTAGTVAGLAASAAMFGVGGRMRDKLERLPLAASLATLALLAAQPMGLKVQAQVTTSGRPGDLTIQSITPNRRGRVQAHRVVTQG